MNEVSVAHECVTRPSLDPGYCGVWVLHGDVCSLESGNEYMETEGVVRHLLV